MRPETSIHVVRLQDSVFFFMKSCTKGGQICFASIPDGIFQSKAHPSRCICATTKFVISRLTSSLISSNDSSVKILRNIVNVAMRKQTPSQRAKTFLEDPFSIHVLLSTLSFEASKHHVQRFQQFMWSQVRNNSTCLQSQRYQLIRLQFNKVDDHLGGFKASDRVKLGDLTRQLQIISQNADIHDGNCNVALVTASGIRDAHARFHVSVGSPPSASQCGTDAIRYVIECMKKQKMWFLNYKSRKDSIMILVHNLVTQQDAANNFQIATDMKRDSTSMNSIAALTMAFLPGTFTAVSLL